MYYRLESDNVESNVFMQQTSHEFTSLIRGALLPTDTPVPFTFNMEVGKDEDGKPMEPRMDAFFPEGNLMKKALVETLRRVGVDNLQTFAAVITDPRTGGTIDAYAVVNVVGLVSCANMAESQASPLADVHYFRELVIDPAKTGDSLLFRLAESQMEIIVHEKVAAAIKAGGFEGVVLEPVREA